MIFISLIICNLFILLAYEIEIIWVIFLLEFQSFIILGSCYVFKNKSLKIKSIEGSLNYIFPAFFSFILMLIYILSISNNYINTYYNNSFFYIIILVSILTKIGSFPIFFWVPNVYKGISYSSLVFIAIISKVFMLLILIHYIPAYYEIIFIAGLFSLFISSIMMVNHINTKKFLAYSSIANVG